MSSRTRNPSGPNRLVVGAVGAAVVTFVAVVAVLSAAETNDLPALSDVAGAVLVDGDPILTPLPSQPGAPDPASGSVSPVVTALDYDTNPVRIGAAGQAQVLVLLAHWCPVCDQELPLLADVVAGGLVPDQVELLLVTTGLDPSRPNWPPRNWLTDAGLGGVLTVRDDATSTLMRTFGLSAYPAWVAIDRDGVVVARHQGLLSPAGVAQLLELAAR
jgi:cytochrome c biogenesis protein CcmG, thiol:disulfide interchange protein DsbE